MSESRWVAYLGITTEGKVVPYITEGELSPIGTRFEKGSNLPGSAYLVFEKGRQVTPEQLIQCLEDLQSWLDRSSHYNKKKVRK